MKRLALLLLPVFAVLLMSHNVSAASRIGNYQSYVSNLTGFPSNGVIINNRLYNISGSGSGALWLANGQFSTSMNWVEGKTYHVSIAVSLDASNLSFVQPEAIHIDGDNYKSTNDNMTSSVSCSSASFCRYTVIHNIDIVAIASGSEVVKTPTSNIINIVITGNFSGSFQMATMLFDDDEQWAEFTSDVSNKLNAIDNNTGDAVDILKDIYSDTTDTVNTLGEINDKLDKLDSNADKNSEAWNNMQNTDGLVDIGDNSQLLSIVGTISTVFDSIKNAPMSETCSISSGDTPVNMGDINLCADLPQWVKDMASFVMTTITFAAVLFMLIGCVNATNKFMDWARHN